MIYEMVIWSVRVVMIVKRFEQSLTEKALYKCSHYHYHYYYYHYYEEEKELPQSFWHASTYLFIPVKPLWGG